MFTFQTFFEWVIANPEDYQANEYEHMEEGEIDHEYDELTDYIRLIDWYV
jgi:hypothetical protein